MFCVPGENDDQILGRTAVVRVREAKRRQVGRSAFLFAERDLERLVPARPLPLQRDDQPFGILAGRLIVDEERWNAVPIRRRYVRLGIVRKAENARSERQVSSPGARGISSARAAVSAQARTRARTGSRWTRCTGPNRSIRAAGCKCDGLVARPAAANRWPAGDTSGHAPISMSRPDTVRYRSRGRPSLRVR